MTEKQGEWKYVACVSTIEEAQAIWETRLQRRDDVCRSVNGICQCCFAVADNKMTGAMHHRNGNKFDFDMSNLIWLCKSCYVQVNGIASGITIDGLRAELT